MPDETSELYLSVGRDVEALRLVLINFSGAVLCFFVVDLDDAIVFFDAIILLVLAIRSFLLVGFNLLGLFLSLDLILTTDLGLILVGFE